MLLQKRTENDLGARITLKNVTSDDDALYRCYINTREDGLHFVNYTVVVVASEDKNQRIMEPVAQTIIQTLEAPDDVNIIYALGGLILLIVLIIIIVIIVTYKTWVIQRSTTIPNTPRRIYVVDNVHAS